MRSKRFLFLALCALLASIVYGQAEAALKPGELNNMVAFYEWVLEARFTPEQRQRLSEELDEEFRQNPTKSRENLNIVQGYWSKIKQGSVDMRRQARAEFLPGYLEELRKRANPKHIFLLEIYKAEHDGRDTFTALDAARGNVIDKTDLHAASGDGPTESLVGLWERHTGTGSITDGTGKTKYGNGTTFSFQFAPDGTIIYKVVEKTLSIMGCKIETASESAGKFNASGAAMDIALAAGTEVGKDSCTKSGNYKKVQPATNLSVKYKIKQSDDVTRPDRPILLCFDNGSGEACFERVPAH
jgi:hypothetical protein